MKRLLALLLALCLLLSACKLPVPPIDETQDTTTQPSTQPTTQPSTQPQQTEKPVHERLIYTMTQADVDEFYRLLKDSEPMAIAGEDLDAIDAITNQLDDQFEFLADQTQIAYVLYCTDQSNDTLSQQYLNASDIVSTAQNDYLEMVRRVYLSETPAKEMLFEDWTEQDIKMLLNHSEEATKLDKRNAEILVEYRALNEADKEEKMIPLYSEMVRNNNRIAQIYGYDNYYEYAYELVYERDYTPDAVVPLRQYLIDYIAPVLDDCYNTFSEKYSAMNSPNQMFMYSLLYEDYDSETTNLVDMYLQDLPEDIRTQMNAVFTENRAYFAENSTAYSGAFTTSFQDEPFIFFGPGYADMNTVVHEMGHFYAARFSDVGDIPLDLAETHSQSNEWLFMAFLQDKLQPQLYETMVSYKLYEYMTMILVCAMVDEFEQKVYTHPNAGNLTAQEYDDLMDQVMQRYGGEDFVNSYITDMQYYWKIVAMESPVYYISYGVSAIAALNVFTRSQTDEENARQIYRQLVEEVDEDLGFLGNIQQAGLPGPFDEEVYQDLNAMFAK